MFVPESLHLNIATMSLSTTWADKLFQTLILRQTKRVQATIYIRMLFEYFKITTIQHNEMAIYEHTCNIIQHNMQIFRWRGGAIGRTSDIRFTDHGFKFYHWAPLHYGLG